MQIEAKGKHQNGYDQYTITYEDGFHHTMYLNDKTLDVADLSQKYKDLKVQSYGHDELVKRGYY